MVCTAVLATPTATVTLDTARSGCESGSLRVTAAGTTGGRQFSRASWSDLVRKDVTLFQQEGAGPAELQSATIDVPFVAGPVPFGTTITLYGYLGSTPPTPETTAEYAITYVCDDSLSIVSSSAGPYGTVSRMAAINYEGLWWRSPPDSESGWGINLAHQGDVIFTTWFTYDASGKPWWLSMIANRTADAAFAGVLYETHGPAFSAMPFDPHAVSSRAVGNGSLVFTGASNGTFAYTVSGVSQSKAITREVFGPMPECVFGASADLAAAANYQDLWYAAPAESEAGWGINLTHQGDVIFATWFTYDASGAPLWLSSVATKTAPTVFAGALNRTTGPAFSAVPFEPSGVRATRVGDMTLHFSSGNAAGFSYSVQLAGTPVVSQTRQLTRQVFRAPGTLCQ